MKRKQMMALLLCGVMAASAGLTGCGNKTTQQGEVADVSKDEVSDDGKVNGVFYKEGLPIVDKEGDYEFSIFFDGTSETGNFWVFDQVKKLTNVNVDLQYQPYDVAREKLSLALSSGDYADCIGGWLLGDSDILKYGVNQKLFIPIEGYIEEYAPNMKKLLEIPGVKEKMTAPDGHIYTIPWVLDAPKVDYQILINTRWLKNVNMEMPTTTEEFYEVLKAFKEQDANGNGDPNDEIPLSFDPNNKHINYLPGWFGVSCDNNGMTMVDGKLDFGANKDEFKEGIKYLNKLYSENLIDQEAFTQDLAVWKSKGEQDMYGACMAYGAGDLMTLDAGEVPDLQALPVLKSPNCDKPVWQANSDGTSVLRTQLVITNKAKNPGAILRFFDTIYDNEISMQTQVGPMNKVLFKESGEPGEEKDGFCYGGYHEGDVYYKDDTKLTNDEKEIYGWGNLYPQSLPKNQPLGYKLKEIPEGYPEKQNIDAQYEPFLNDVIPSYWMPLDKADEMSETITAIRDYVEQKTAEWIAGNADIDAEWDAYKAQLDDYGLQEYLKMRQETVAAAK